MSMNVLKEGEVCEVHDSDVGDALRARLHAMIKLKNGKSEEVIELSEEMKENMRMCLWSCIVEKGCKNGGNVISNYVGSCVYLREKWCVDLSAKCPESDLNLS